MGAGRSAYWDNWRGLAIFAVVAIHACNATQTFPAGSFNWGFGLTFRQLINFAVPLFLALAGYFSASAAKQSAGAYYGKRLWRILLPYLIWTAFYLLMKTPRTLPGTQEVLEGIAFGKGIGIGYYVIVLLQFTLLTPLLVRISSKAVHALIILAVTLLGLAFTYYLKTQHPDHFFATFPGSGLPFFVWYPFYHFGLLIALNKRDIHLGTGLSVGGCIVAVGLAMVEAFYWAGEGKYSFGASQVKAASFLASLMLFLAVVAYEERETWLDKRSWVTWVGENSFAFYLIHLLPLHFALGALSKFKQIFGFQPAFILLATTISIVATASCVWAGRRFLPGRIAREVLG